jgi:hypothetical protein
MTNLQKRLRQLEVRRAQRKPPRLVVRFQGGAGEGPGEPEADIDESDENTTVVVVQYVDMPAKAPLGPTRRRRLPDAYDDSRSAFGQRSARQRHLTPRRGTGFEERSRLPASSLVR